MLLRESKKCTWQIVDSRGERLEKWRVEIAQVCFTGFHGQDTDGTDLSLSLSPQNKGAQIKL